MLDEVTAMTVALNSEEIYTALTDYVRRQGVPLEGKKVQITVKAGRKGNGPSALVSVFTPEEEDSPVFDTEPVTRRVVEVPDVEADTVLEDDESWLQ